MNYKVGILSDRLANRLVRYLPSPKVDIKTDVPVISFTMDDIPFSAWSTGARILEEEGARGTFYISGGLMGDADGKHVSHDGCRDLQAKGHEVACHTFSHPKLIRKRPRELAEDLDKNKAELDRVLGAEYEWKRNFAVPYGMAHPVHQPMLRDRFRTSRSVIAGINRSRTDVHYLAAVELQPKEDVLKRANDYLDEVFRTPGWLIYFTHDISKNPSFYGCDEDFFRSLVRRAKERGAKIITVNEAADYFGIPNRAA